MATVKIEFATDNAAFEDDYLGEMKSVLDYAAACIRMNNKDGREADTFTLRDSNGNIVGKVTVE